MKIWENEKYIIQIDFNSQKNKDYPLENPKWLQFYPADTFYLYFCFKTRRCSIHCISDNICKYTTMRHKKLLLKDDGKASSFQQILNLSLNLNLFCFSQISHINLV